MSSVADLDDFLAQWPMSGSRTLSAHEVRQARVMRGWHLHVARSHQSVADRLGAGAAMGLADLIRADSVDRLRHCRADQCAHVLVDLSKNRSRRFCSITCANRTHAAASRARRSGAAR